MSNSKWYPRCIGAKPWLFSVPSSSSILASISLCHGYPCPSASLIQYLHYWLRFHTLPKIPCILSLNSSASFVPVEAPEGSLRDRIRVQSLHRLYCGIARESRISLAWMCWMQHNVTCGLHKLTYIYIWLSGKNPEFDELKKDENRTVISLLWR